MAYQIGLNMGIAEKAILSAIEDLQEKETAFNYKDIAAAVPCSEPTIWRYMPKLIEARKVVRVGIKHSTSSRYEVVKEEAV
jgi:response regulator of citrate/malate metabolism